MPRAIWSGAISFGLVNVPVRMYSAVEEKDIHFHYVHEKDGARIGYEKVCKKENKPVPDDEIVKAYEYAKGKYVYMTDEDFEAAEPEGYKTIEITDFVAYDEIDPIYGPARGDADEVEVGEPEGARAEERLDEEPVPEGSQEGRLI